MTRARLEAVLPPLLTAGKARGWRALVQTTDAARLEALSQHLWTHDDRSFLAHGRADDAEMADFAALQPIWLTDKPENPNGAQLLFLLDGAARDDLADFARIIFIFDGNDAAAVAAARTTWTRLKAEGFALAYWQQSQQGKWEKKAG